MKLLLLRLLLLFVDIGLEKLLPSWFGFCLWSASVVGVRCVVVVIDSLSHTHTFCPGRNDDVMLHDSRNKYVCNQDPPKRHV
jgi:hypothetical protein